jgi:DNA excision repair protein ERCC-2
MPKRYLSLSVHGLVDFLLRAGDIDSRVYNQETMVAGSKIHSSFQHKQGREYLSEYPLAETFERPEATIRLEGRADGIICGGEFPIIDEIKSTVAPLEVFYEEQKPWHLGQAKCYALMYVHAEKLDRIGIRLTYISQVDNSQMVKESIYSLAELESGVYGLMDEYLAFYKMEFAREETRNASASSLPFPYPRFRQGQRDMAKYAYGTATGGGIFFCEAPTGIGKTMSALYPAVKAFAKTDNQKIFYLTAKSTGRDSAYEAMGRLYGKGLLARDSVLTAKDKMCFVPGAACNPAECPYAKGYYTKLKKVIAEALESGVRFDCRHVVALAKKWETCPFELQLDLSLFSDVIICDYNYLFDPLVHLERYFDPTQDSSHYVALVDEAHNLVERGRDMYSSSLDERGLLEARKAVRKLKEPELKKALGRFDKFFLSQKTLHPDGSYDYSVIPPEVPKMLEALSIATLELGKKEHPRLGDAYKDFTREAHRFSFLLENYLSHSLVYFDVREGNASLHLYSLDPSQMLADSLSRLKGAIVFSATLSPIDYYMDAIVGRHDCPFLLLPSPFPRENFDLLVAPMVSTRYKDRASTYEKVASYLSAFVKGKLGNYFIYFPSYEYLDRVKPYLSFPDAQIYEQEREMSDEDKGVFLSRFLSDPDHTSVGLLIIGGTFAEGIDLAADRLIGVAIVGIGLPQICHDRDLIKDYFDKSNGEGFEYAYINPGINKVMQAMGRLIRSETDVGAALLIDDRYLHDEYRDLFARSWRGYEVATSVEDVSENLRAFYKKAAE